MSHLRAYRNAGLIPRASGAAVAALKTRAAEWDVELTETPDALSLVIWGCELRLIPETDAVRLELSGPEPRLLGNLQDSATEIFAEAGLEVQWERVNTGALAPGLAVMRVVSVTQRSKGFLRVRLQGPEASRFAQGSLHFRLLLPRPGRMPVWPRIGHSGRTIWPVGPDALHRPVYTVAAQQEDWLDFDIFCHSGSPTCDWALSGPEGHEVAIVGPGGGWCPEAGRLWLFGDETALPAITRMLDLARGHVQAVIRAEECDLGPLASDPRVRRSDDLLAALAQADLGGAYIWFAAHADEARQARSHLLARGIGKKDFTAAAYWG